MAVATKWAIRGSYFESCNCDPICPCRRVDGVSVGRSTHGICLGALSWVIEDGRVDEIELAGLTVAMSIMFDDDEPGSPWRWVLYLDERGSEAQLEALEGIFTGRLGGDAERHFPWAWKASELLAVRRVPIEVDHTPRRQWLRVRDHVTVRIRDRFPGEAAVTCVVPGHDRDGEELITDELRVDDSGLEFELSGVCGYASTFAYAG